MKTDQRTVQKLSTFAAFILFLVYAQKADFGSNSHVCFAFFAPVTESESWSFSLGLKDFFPPAPVRCPNSP